MLAGDSYRADDPEIAADGLRCALLLREYNVTSHAEPTLRAALLRDLLGSVGAGSVIRSPLQCDYGYHTTIGARSFANWGLVLLDVGRISIGDNMWLGGGVIVLPGVTIGPDTVVGPWQLALLDFNRLRDVLRDARLTLRLDAGTEPIDPGQRITPRRIVI